MTAATADAFASPSGAPAAGARQTLHEVVAGMEPIGLAQVLEAAALQTRVDRKYLVPASVFAEVGAELARSHRVLQMADRRVFAYESVYFDTPDLALYRAHVQGRRRRYKVRTRTYLDTEDTMFEVKLKGYRGQTVKRRLPYDTTRRLRLDREARAFLDGWLRQEYDVAAPELSPSVTTTYTRCTMVDPVAGSRVTCDVDLRCHGAIARWTPDGHVLVETKSAGGQDAADVLLHRLGMRPVSVSKYCVGVALLHPEMPANPWHRSLHRYFGYAPPSAVGHGEAALTTIR